MGMSWGTCRKAITTSGRFDSAPSLSAIVPQITQRKGEKIMARIRMVTRNVSVVSFDVMTVNMDTLQVENLTVDVPSADSLPEKQIVTLIQNSLSAHSKYVTHTAKEHKEVLYGMPESDFIRLAKVLPPRSKSDTVEE